MQQVIKQLYRHWPIVRRSLKEKGCTGMDAEDIFQEALLIYCRKTEDPHFILEVEPIFFVRQTCIFLWYNQARKEQKTPQVLMPDELPNLEEDWMEKEERISRIEQVIEKLGEQCRSILTLFYGKKWSMEEIAKKVGLRNDKVVKAQKYRCIQKVKDQLQKTEL